MAAPVVWSGQLQSRRRSPVLTDTPSILFGRPVPHREEAEVEEEEA